jgi:hypothetical protein
MPTRTDTITTDTKAWGAPAPINIGDTTAGKMWIDNGATLDDWKLDDMSNQFIEPLPEHRGLVDNIEKAVAKLTTISKLVSDVAILTRQLEAADALSGKQIASIGGIKFPIDKIEVVASIEKQLAKVKKKLEKLVEENLPNLI